MSIFVKSPILQELKKLELVYLKGVGSFGKQRNRLG